MDDNLYIEFVASPALYEEGQPLHGSNQQDIVVVGPVSCYHMIYNTIRVLMADYDERHIGSLCEDGLWRLGMSMAPAGDTVVVTPRVNPDALVFSDMSVSTTLTSGVQVLAFTDFPED